MQMPLVASICSNIFDNTTTVVAVAKIYCLKMSIGGGTAIRVPGLVLVLLAASIAHDRTLENTSTAVIPLNNKENKSSAYSHNIYFQWWFV